MVLVNNAGVNGAIGEAGDLPTSRVAQAIEVNLLGTVFATRAAIPFMRQQESGKIVNLAGGGIGGPSVATRVSAYVSPKAAVVPVHRSDRA